MARIRPFRGLRYTLAAGGLDSLLAPPTLGLTPSDRDRYAVRNPHSAVMLAQPEGHGDDRSKFVRYARAAAHLAEGRRGGFLALEASPAFYRLTQRFGTQPTTRISLVAVADLQNDVRPVEAGSPKLREERLRLLEATRTVFEPTVALFEDPTGAILRAVRSAPATSESDANLDAVSAVLETIDDPDALATLENAFSAVPLLLADNVEAYEAAAAFPGGTGALVALSSLDEASFARLSVHRVLRRLPGGKEAALDRLAGLFEIEEHHNRNLILHIDRASDAGSVAFGMATEGGLGYLLKPRGPVEGPASIWIQDTVFGPVFNANEGDPSLMFTDPVQAVRAADEGAAAAFIMPRPAKDEIRDVARSGALLPARSAQTYPAVPTGLVYWSMGDDV